MVVNIFEALVALLGVVSAVSYAVGPSIFRDTVVHQTIGNWAYIWLFMYGTSGVAILYGLIRINTRVEAAGLIVFGTGTIINGIALAVAFRASALISLATLMAAAATCFIRAYSLTRGKIVVVVEETQ